ncbi:MAG: 16S rRNA processing protein RimM [Lactobacillales bacterium]|nr:16S rRNA processing protein RimM [Lactobacillales bacterium]
MDFIYVGEIVNTHGIKGEVRIISEFKYKKEVFKKGFKIYIDKEKEMTINTYRVHKMYDMVTFEDINDINDVIEYKGLNVYINREDLKIDGILDEDIIGLNAYSIDKEIGVVTEILKSKAHDILVVEKNNIRSLIPYINEFVEEIDLENKKIYIKEIEGLINED